jgi:hypothetical protein
MRRRRRRRRRRQGSEDRRWGKKNRVVGRTEGWARQG